MLMQCINVETSIGLLTPTSITLIDIFHKGPSGEIMACLCQGALFMENYPRCTNGQSIELIECVREQKRMQQSASMRAGKLYLIKNSKRLEYFKIIKTSD